MNKSLIATLLALFAVVNMAAAFSSGERVRCTASGVNVRTSPSTSASSIGTLNTGDLGTVQNSTVYSGSGYTWQYIKWDKLSQSGYTALDWVAAASTVYTLTIASSNPSSGVYITVGPNDKQGLADGNTSFTRQYNSGTSITVIAPTTANGNSFSKWTVNGTDYSSRTVNFTLSGNYTATAVFASAPVVTHTVTVASSPSGVAIGSNTLDNNTNAGGTTTFTRVFNQNATATYTAPATSSGNNFQKWQRDGVDLTTSTTASITVDANRTLTAVYAPPSTPTPTPSTPTPTPSTPTPTPSTPTPTPSTPTPSPSVSPSPSASPSPGANSPTISRVEPNPVPGSGERQPVAVYGTNFGANAVVNLRNLTTGLAYPNVNVSADRTSTRLVMNVILGTPAHTWLVEVVNLGFPAAEYRFQVTSPTSSLSISGPSAALPGASASYSVFLTGDDGQQSDVTALCTFSFLDPQPSDAVMSNSSLFVGRAAAATTLRLQARYINGSAHLLSPPYSVVVAGSMTANLSVTAQRVSSTTFSVALNATATGGTAPYTFRWSRDGASVAVGQQSSFTLTSDGGTYRIGLQVSDSTGAQASASQSLTVDKPPVTNQPIRVKPTAPVGHGTVYGADGHNFQFTSARRDEWVRGAHPRAVFQWFG